jgi:low affinity Fe/Cu permease
MSDRSSVSARVVPIALRLKRANRVRESGHPEPGQADVFRKFAHKVSTAVGTPVAFFIAMLVLVAWAVSGPVFGFSDTWQLIINTGTTIVTFLMVFLIQSTQNRDAEAVHLKLDELIRATSNARDDLVALEQMSEAELHELEAEFQRMRKKACDLRAAQRREKHLESADAGEKRLK